MILDGINMEDGARRGVEKVTREIRKNLIVRRSIDCVISLTFYAFATYFKKQKNIRLQVICIAIPIAMNGVVVFAYNAYLLHSRGKILIRILSKTVDSAKSQISLKKRVESEDDKRLVLAFNKFQRIIPIAIFNVIVSAQSMFALTLWAVLTIDTVDGMAYISPFIAFMISVFMLSSYMITNNMFVVWFPSEITQNNIKKSVITLPSTKKLSLESSGSL